MSRPLGAGGTASKSGGTSGKKVNDTIECLLNIRSVRDQFKDAGLDLANDKVAEQLEELEDRLVDHLAEERELRDGVGLLTVAVVGDFNSGKSTFINALLGTELCPVGDEPTTASVTHFIHGDKQRFELERDGTRKSVERGTYRSMVRHSKVGDREAYVFHVSMDSPVLEHIRLVDTPGFNAPPPNTNDTSVTDQAVATADALFVIMDVRKGDLSKTLLEKLDRLENTRRNEPGPPAFLLLNWADRKPPNERNEVKKDSEKNYGERFRNVALVSAKLLIDTDEPGPLDAVETTTRRIRASLSRQESFDAKISAKVVTERGQENYRMDIDGNVFEASLPSDGELASREQLVAMVRSVASERHALLKTQFRRRKSQFRKDWMSIAYELDSLCKRAAKTSTRADDATDAGGQEALKTIDEFKRQILELVDCIFHDVAKEGISTGEYPALLSDETFYYIDVRVDEAFDLAEKHDYWDKVRTIVRSLIDSLKWVPEPTVQGPGFTFRDVANVRDPDRIASALREHCLQNVCDSLREDRVIFEELEYWKRKEGAWWRRVYKEEETLRDDHYDQLTQDYESDLFRWTRCFTHALQMVIDQLQESTIRGEERDQAEVRERDDELTKLRERIDELTEYAP